MIRLQFIMKKPKIQKTIRILQFNIKKHQFIKIKYKIQNMKKKLRLTMKNKSQKIMIKL